MKKTLKPLDVFGFEIKKNSMVYVPGERNYGYTGCIDTPFFLGKVLSTEVFPTGKAMVSVEFFTLTEVQRTEPEYKKYKDETQTERFWSSSVISQEVLRATRPELFL